jgi:hypothetical protein
VKDENGDLLAGSDNIFSRWRNYSQLLNVEIHTAEPLVCGPILLKLKLLLRGSDQIAAELIQGGGGTLLLLLTH